jgi:hypothetical protein
VHKSSRQRTRALPKKHETLSNPDISENEAAIAALDYLELGLGAQALPNGHGINAAAAAAAGTRPVARTAFVYAGRAAHAFRLWADDV